MSDPVTNPGKVMFSVAAIGAAGVAAAFFYGMLHGEQETPDLTQITPPQEPKQLRRRRTILFHRSWPDGRKETMVDRREEV